MTNLHSMKNKKKNITRSLGKLYKSKHQMTEKIKELETARTTIISLMLARKSNKKKVKNKK